MSRIFTDADLLTWEAYTSAGAFGLPENPKIVFHCLSDPDRPARVITRDGSTADVTEAVLSSGDRELRALLERAVEM
jgi:hypothetical protein